MEGELRRSDCWLGTARLHLEDGSDVGEAAYAQMIYPGEEIIAGSNERFRMVDLVEFDEEDESPFVGVLQVEAAQRPLFALSLSPQLPGEREPKDGHAETQNKREDHGQIVARPAEEILYGSGRRFRVLEVVPLEEEDESPFVGMLKVEAA